MRYLIAIFCPPLAILLCGKVVTAMFSGALWVLCVLGFMLGGFLGWVVLMAHAWIVIAEHKRRVAYQYRRVIVLAIASLACFSVATAGEMTLERAEKFQQLWDKEQTQMLKEANAEMMEIRRLKIMGIGTDEKNKKRAATYYNQIKRKHEPLTYPKLNDKKVGSIGLISCLSGSGWPIVERGDYLTLDPTFYGVGSRDNGATTYAVPIPGYGKFMVRNFDEKYISGDNYLGAALVYEVVAMQDGIPVVEPFDVKAAKKLLAGKKRKPIKTD